MTLDALSDGRAILGVGAGHLQASSTCSGSTTRRVAQPPTTRST